MKTNKPNIYAQVILAKIRYAQRTGKRPTVVTMSDKDFNSLQVYTANIFNANRNNGYPTPDFKNTEKRCEIDSLRIQIEEGLSEITCN